MKKNVPSDSENWIVLATLKFELHYISWNDEWWCHRISHHMEDTLARGEKSDAGWCWRGDMSVIIANIRQLFACSFVVGECLGIAWMGRMVHSCAVESLTDACECSVLTLLMSLYLRRWSTAARPSVSRTHMIITMIWLESESERATCGERKMNVFPLLDYELTV